MEDVLIVGARTTGLMRAIELARRDIPLRVIDKSPGIDPHVRANLIHSRTLEIFQGLDLARTPVRWRTQLCAPSHPISQEVSTISSRPFACFRGLTAIGTLFLATPTRRLR